MNHDIVTIITSLFGYGGVAVAVERLRREFVAYKAEQKKLRDEVDAAVRAVLNDHNERISALENRAA